MNAPCPPEPPPERVIEVAAGLVFRDGRLLLTQRRAGDHLGGLWEFPGGKREAGETFSECLRRELREELAIEVVVGRCLETVGHEYPGRRVYLEFYRCEWAAGEPQTIGCQDLAWVTRETLGNYAFPAADAQLLARLTQSGEWWQAG